MEPSKFHSKVIWSIFAIVGFMLNLRCQRHQLILEECFGAVKDMEMVICGFFRWADRDDPTYQVHRTYQEQHYMNYPSTNANHGRQGRHGRHGRQGRHGRNERHGRQERSSISVDISIIVFVVIWLLCFIFKMV